MEPAVAETLPGWPDRSHLPALHIIQWQWVILHAPLSASPFPSPYCLLLSRTSHSLLLLHLQVGRGNSACYALKLASLPSCHLPPFPACLPALFWGLVSCTFFSSSFYHVPFSDMPCHCHLEEKKGSSTAFFFWHGTLLHSMPAMAILCGYRRRTRDSPVRGRLGEISTYSSHMHDIALSIAHAWHGSLLISFCGTLPPLPSPKTLQPSLFMAA